MNYTTGRLLLVFFLKTIPDHCEGVLNYLSRKKRAVLWGKARLALYRLRKLSALPTFAEFY